MIKCLAFIYLRNQNTGGTMTGGGDSRTGCRQLITNGVVYSLSYGSLYDCAMSYSLSYTNLIQLNVFYFFFRSSSSQGILHDRRCTRRQHSLWHSLHGLMRTAAARLLYRSCSERPDSVEYSDAPVCWPMFSTVHNKLKAKSNYRVAVKRFVAKWDTIYFYCLV